jgi:hypothetical protein
MHNGQVLWHPRADRQQFGDRKLGSVTYGQTDSPVSTLILHYTLLCPFSCARSGLATSREGSVFLELLMKSGHYSACML